MGGGHGKAGRRKQRDRRQGGMRMKQAARHEAQAPGSRAAAASAASTCCRFCRLAQRRHPPVSLPRHEPPCHVPVRRYLSDATHCSLALAYATHCSLALGALSHQGGAATSLLLAPRVMREAKTAKTARCRRRRQHEARGTVPCAQPLPASAACLPACLPVWWEVGGRLRCLPYSPRRALASSVAQ